jgi:ribonuclease-3
VSGLTLDALQQDLGYTFADRGLLELALTHRSWSEEEVGQQSTHLVHNERLEFLGDTVLNLSITHLLCDRFPETTEGDLSRVRSSLVGTSTLGRVAAALGLGEVLRLGRGEERSGGRGTERLLANGLEAVLGAVFLDSGYPAAREVVAGLWQDHLEGIRDVSSHGLDPKSRLQQETQARFGEIPRYEITDQDGPAHNRRFQATVTVGGVMQVVGGFASKKQDASRLAARAALEQIQALDAAAEGGEE